jgi:hypothetical protein
MSKTELDLDNLYERAYNSGTSRGPDIPSADIAQIIAELQATDDTSLQTRLMIILKYAGASAPLLYRHVLEPFLTDPLHCCQVLWILCEDWRLTALYTNTVGKLIRGMPWPERYQCRLEALHSATSYLSTHKDPKLLQAILEMYEGNAEGSYLRGLAYNSLYHLAGEPDVSESQVVSMVRE